MQVRDRWRSVVNTCFAGYSAPRARIMPGDSFERAWYAYPNITAVELAINTTLIEADEMPANAEQVNARKVTLDGFKFNSSTRAGIYRGRLSNIYQCEPPLSHTASCGMLHALTSLANLRYRNPRTAVLSPCPGQNPARLHTPHSFHQACSYTNLATTYFLLPEAIRCINAVLSQQLYQIQRGSGFFLSVSTGYVNT